MIASDRALRLCQLGNPCGIKLIQFKSIVSSYSLHSGTTETSRYLIRPRGTAYNQNFVPSPSILFPRMPSIARQRSGSSDGAGPSKKSKASAPSHLAISLPSGEHLDQYRRKYAEATPFRYAAVGGLLNDNLVRRYSTDREHYSQMTLIA